MMSCCRFSVRASTWVVLCFVVFVNAATGVLGPTLTSPVFDCSDHPAWDSFRWLTTTALAAETSAHLPARGGTAGAGDDVGSEAVVEEMFKFSSLIVNRFTAVEDEWGHWIHGFSFERVLEQLAGGDGTWSTTTDSCFYGFITALYVEAWAVAAEPQSGSQAEVYLRVGNIQLKMNDLDFLENSGWPVTSWDFAYNLQRLAEGEAFLPRPPRPPQVHGILQNLHLPGVWPAWTPSDWQLTHRGEVSATASSKFRVWWTGMHVAPFLDVLTVLDDYFDGMAEVDHNALAGYHCQFHAELCTKDDGLKALMHHERLFDQSEGQWQGARRVHSEFESVISAFQAMYAPRFRSSGVSLLMCGHPLFWCRLYDGLDIPYLGVYDNPHTLFVPVERAKWWTSELARLFPSAFPGRHAARRSMLVGFSPFQALQAGWATGAQMPFTRPLALGKPQGAYHGELSDRLLILPSITHQTAEVLKYFAGLARASKSLDLEVFRWPQDLPCGAHCSKHFLASHRAAVVWPYDIAHLKFTEMYAMGVPLFVPSQLWRWTMRWSQTSDPALERIAMPRAGSDASGIASVKTSDCAASHAQSAFASDQCLKFNFEAVDWTNPWDLVRSEGQQGPPFGSLPFAPFSFDRWSLDAIGTAFWAELSEFALRPHLRYFDTFADLFHQVGALGPEDLRATSEAMGRWQRDALVAVVVFWRSVLVGLSADGGSFNGSGSSDGMPTLREYLGHSGGDL